MSLCAHSGVNAGVHLCAACARRGQSVVSHKLPVLIFFLKALSPDGARSHQCSYTGWPGSPRDHLASILPVWSCTCHFFWCFVLVCFMWALEIKFQARSASSSHQAVSSPRPSFVRDVSSSVTFLSGFISPEQFPELLLSFFPIWMMATTFSSHGNKLAKGIKSPKPQAQEPAIKKHHYYHHLQQSP